MAGIFILINFFDDGKFQCTIEWYYLQTGAMFRYMQYPYIINLIIVGLLNFLADADFKNQNNQEYLHSRTQDFVMGKDDEWENDLLEDLDDD